MAAGCRSVIFSNALARRHRPSEWCHLWRHKFHTVVAVTDAKAEATAEPTTTAAAAAATAGKWIIYIRMRCRTVECNHTCVCLFHLRRLRRTSTTNWPVLHLCCFEVFAFAQPQIDEKHIEVGIALKQYPFVRPPVRLSVSRDGLWQSLSSSLKQPAQTKLRLRGAISTRWLAVPKHRCVRPPPQIWECEDRAENCLCRQECFRSQHLSDSLLWSKAFLTTETIKRFSSGTCLGNSADENSLIVSVLISLRVVKIISAFTNFCTGPANCNFVWRV